MRKKLLSNNEITSISKGGILYRPGEIPVLTKSQAEQAKLVAKLPQDFPIANWENMGTKQQLQQMKYSGLNAQEQWSLLNSNVPLTALSQYNQAQTQSASTALAARVAASLVSAFAKAAVPPTPTPGDASSNYTPLQSGGLREKLNTMKEEFKKTPAGNTSGKVTGKASGRTGGAIPFEGTMKAWAGSEIVNPNSPPTITPFKYNIDLVTPTPTPRMTPTPSPTSTPTPTPTPTPSLSEQRAQAAVKEGIRLADKGVEYTWGGKKVEDGLDCSGLVVILLKNVGFKFGNGNLSLGSQYMANSFLTLGLGTSEYDYTKDNKFPPLQAGDLVFSADADNPKVNKHVMMATGNGMQVVEASSVTGVNKVTYQFDSYKTERNGRYYRDSGQIITQVIRPKY